MAVEETDKDTVKVYNSLYTSLPLSVFGQICSTLHTSASMIAIKFLEHAAPAQQ